MPQEKPAIFSIKSIIQDLLYAHSPYEFIDFFCAGSRNTTPHLYCIEARWGFPWRSALFTLALIIFVLTFMIAEYWAREGLSNVKLFLGVIMVGSVAVPLGLLSVFAEMNLWRNITWVRTLMLGCVGGVLSIVFALLLSIFPLSASPFSIGFIEETCKISVVFLIAGKKWRNGYILNGMLLGSAVGAGFAIFESMGYAYEALFVNIGNAQDLAIDYQNSLSIMAARSIFCLTAGHVTWTAITSAALWSCMNGRKRVTFAIFHPIFLFCLAASACIHGVWNMSTFRGNILYLAPLLGLITWVFIATFYHCGIVQIRRKQRAWYEKNQDEACFRLESDDYNAQGPYSAKELVKICQDNADFEDLNCLIGRHFIQRAELSQLSFIRATKPLPPHPSWYQMQPPTWFRMAQILGFGTIGSILLCYRYPEIGIAGYVFTSTILTCLLLHILISTRRSIKLPDGTCDAEGTLPMPATSFGMWLRLLIPVYQLVWGYSLAINTIRSINYGRKGRMIIPLWIPALYWISFSMTITLCTIIIVWEAYSFGIYAGFFVLLYPFSAYLMSLALMSADELITD